MTVYRIRWRRQYSTWPTVEGLSQYKTEGDAEKQVLIWEALYPQNKYYIVPEEI